jgi:hypothetical protein
MKNLVIGAISNYTFDQLKPWVNSLEQSGFDGYKMLVCYNVDADTAKQLHDRGFILGGLSVNEQGTFTADPNLSIVVNRFIHYWTFLSQLSPAMKQDIRYVIATDVKDVVFQKNPSKFFDEWPDIIEPPGVVVASESLKYRDESWGINNLVQSFGPAVSSSLLDTPIVNCGSFAAKFDIALGLFLSIYLISNGAQSHFIPGGGGPDQAALNILVNTEAYRSITYVTDNGWAAQLGTTMDPNKIGRYRPLLLNEPPIIVNDQVCTPSGVPFYLVHQYDRVPELKALFEAKYA